MVCEWASKILPEQVLYVIWNTCPADNLEKNQYGSPRMYSCDTRTAVTANSITLHVGENFFLVGQNVELHAYSFV